MDDPRNDAPPKREDIVSELDKIGRSEAFSNRSAQMHALRCLIGLYLGGAQKASYKAPALAGILLGLETSTEKHDVLVRQTLRRLREALNKYYEIEGRDDKVKIVIPKGTFMPGITPNQALEFEKLNTSAALLLASAKISLDRRTANGHDEAFEYLDLALNLHPGHPRLLSMKAIAHVSRAVYCNYPLPDLEKARNIIEEIKALPTRIPWECIYAEAEVQCDVVRDWDRAKELFEIAIRRSGGEAKYRTWYTSFLAAKLRSKEAIERLREAVSDGDHDSQIVRADLIGHLILGGEFKDAEEMLRVTLHVHKDIHYMFYIYSSMLQEAMGHAEEAAAIIGKLPVTVRQSNLYSGLGYLFSGLAGDVDKARRGCERLKTFKIRRNQWIPAMQIAVACLGAGDHEGAIDWYYKSAQEEYDPNMTWVAILPYNRHLYRYERFRNLVTMVLELPLSPRFLEQSR